MNRKSVLNRMPMFSAALIVLALLVSVQWVGAHILAEGETCIGVVCPVANRPECTCDYVTCHWYCVLTAADVAIDTTTGKVTADTLINGGTNLVYLQSVGAGRESILTAETRAGIQKQEQALADYYDAILNAEPKSFWGNYDYATLKMMQNDYTTADRLYYNAISTLDPATKIEMLDTMRLANREKLKLSEESLKNNPSAFLSKMGNDIKDAVKSRVEDIKYSISKDKIAVPQPEDYDNEKLTLLSKYLGKKMGICSDPTTCNQCVSNVKSYGSCVVNGMTGVTGQ